MLTKVLINVNGLVQGVGYRYFCYRKAMEYDIKGYAKNLFDGSVEVLAIGNKNLINDFIKDLKRGPVNSYVKSLTVEDLDPGSEVISDMESNEFKML